MAKYRKLGRTSDQRKALLRNQVTALLYHGKIVTTAAKAEEIQKIAEKMITLAIKEKDNFDTVTVEAKVARKDKDGKRVKQIVDKNDPTKVLAESAHDKNGKIVRVENGKTVTVYDTVQKEIKKDRPSRLHARRQIEKVVLPVTEVPTEAAGRKKNTKTISVTQKLFDEIAPKYANRNGGYTRIVKIGQRKGDAAMQVLIELV
ncbi:MAG: 50S ribosomal protein L17 [Lachnospiraceae bacterium]|nr:50S ribosomal protein L17 [Lachnospiraceae bacterium]